MNIKFSKKKNTIKINNINEIFAKTNSDLKKRNRALTMLLENRGDNSRAKTLKISEGDIVGRDNG